MTTHLSRRKPNTNRTLVTYYQVPMQKQWAVNQQSIKGKPYAKYFTKDLVVPVDMVNAVESGPLAKQFILPPTVDGLRTLLTDFAKYPVSGYALIEAGPLAYAQSHHLFPGVTARMFEWWMTWHPLESERYMLWFPYAHIHNSVADPQRLANDSLSYGERLYGNPNHITEYIGGMFLDGVIHFDTPESLGVDKSLHDAGGFSFNASGIISTRDSPQTPLVLMIHLGRDTPAGLEMINRYWIGTHPSFDRFAKFPDGARLSKELTVKMGLDRTALENFAYEMALHDMTEFTCLGKLLPDIYRDYGLRS
jgi:2,4-diacetylphloroglucinol hydrolase